MKLTLDDFQLIAKNAIENLDDQTLTLTAWNIALTRAVRAAADDYVSGLESDDDE